MILRDILWPSLSSNSTFSCLNVNFLVNGSCVAVREVGTMELPPHNVFINVDLPDPLSPIIMMEKLMDFFKVFLFLKAAEETFSVE